MAEPDEAALRDIRVRLESRSLRTAAGELMIETETDGDGLFGRQILVGEWRASFIPPYDSIYGSVAEDFTVSPGLGFVDLGSTSLPERVEFEGFITDPTGEPVTTWPSTSKRSTLTATSSTTTDEDGGFSVEPAWGHDTDGIAVDAARRHAGSVTAESAKPARSRR